MRISYKTAKFTAKLNGATVRGTFTPDGTVEHFTNFLTKTARRFGMRGAGFDREVKYDWGTTIFANTNKGTMVIFLRVL
jgi:hypothetical protein